MEMHRELAGREAAASGSAAPRGDFLLDRLAHRPVRTPAGVLLPCGAGLLLIFAADCLTPGELHPEMLYALVILGGLWLRRAALILVLVPAHQYLRRPRVSSQPARRPLLDCACEPGVRRRPGMDCGRPALCHRADP